MTKYMYIILGLVVLVLIFVFLFLTRSVDKSIKEYYFNPDKSVKTVKNPIAPVDTSNAQVNTYSFNEVFYIDLDTAKSEYPEREFFKPDGTEVKVTLSVLELELKKNNYTEASKRNIQLVGQIVDGKKQIYAFMWTMGGPLDANIEKNKYDPQKDYLTHMIFDGGSQYIDAVVSLDKNSDYYSALVISFVPHGEA